MIDTALRQGYAPVNGLQMYYEIHGEGQPLVLIHGGFGLVGMFGALLPMLAETRQVIAVELQGHGHTADIDRPFNLEWMAGDVAALIGHLGIERADILGYSLGGGVALQTAIHHADAVRKLILVATPYRHAAWYPEVQAGMAQVNVEAMMGTFIHDAYVQVAPRPQDFSKLAAKTQQLLATSDFDLTAEVRALPMPVLIVAGDADGFPPTHPAEMFALLGGGQRDAGWDRSNMPVSQLAILPGTTHYEILDRTELLLPIIISFLDAPVREAK